MGLVHAELEVRKESGPSETVSFLVDSGAVSSVLPWRVRRRLGLVLNPFERKLRPMRMRLASILAPAG